MRNEEFLKHIQNLKENLDSNIQILFKQMNHSALTILNDYSLEVISYQNKIEEIKKEHSKEIANINAKFSNFDNLKTDYENQILSLKNKNKELEEEMKNLKKVSLLGAMNKQIKEKDLIIEQLNKKIELLKIKSIPVSIASTPKNEPVDEIIFKEEPLVVTKDILDEEPVQEDEVSEEIEEQSLEEATEEVNEEVEEETVEEEDEVEEEQEDDIEYEVEKIGKKYYYVSNEEPKGIYLVIKETNEVGDKVGEFKNNKATFF